MAEQDFDDMQSFLSFRGNTDDAIRWDRLQERIAASPLPLSRKGQVGILVRLANGAKVTGREWNQFVGLPILNGLDDRPIALPTDTVATVVNNLSVIAEGSEKARADAIQAIVKELSGKVLIAPLWNASRGRHDRLIARDMGAAILYAMWLLTDKDSELSGKLCRCRYSKCRKFFLKRPGKGGKGAPRSKYCTVRHQEMADSENARGRMQLRRGTKS